MQKKVKGNKGELYCISKDADVQLDCLDIVALKLNDFTQAFRDLVIFIRKKMAQQKRENLSDIALQAMILWDFSRQILKKIFCVNSRYEMKLRMIILTMSYTSKSSYGL